MRRTRRLLLVAIPVTSLAVAAGVAFWTAERTLRRSADVARSGHRIAFSVRQLDVNAAPALNPGFQPVAAPDAFSSGTILDGNFYLAGANGLTIVSADGASRRTLRTGFELPVEQIIAVASGRLRGASEAQVLLATAGAGVLLLEPTEHGAPVVHQLLAESAEARDITAMLPMASGDLLLGTRHGGVLNFDGAALTPLEHLAGREITALAAADSASVLVGTRNEGVFFLHAGMVDHADAAAGMPDAQVEAIAVAGGKAFVGTPLGVAEFDLAQGTFRPEQVLAAGTFSHALALAPDGLLVGTLDQGVRPVGLGAQPRLRNASLPIHAGGLAGSGSTERIDGFIGRASALYAIADGRLVARSGTGWTSALGAGGGEALADRNISALAFAPDGTLYVGFFDHGLDVVGANGAIRHLKDDHLFCVNRLALDPKRQTMAAATANGLVLFDAQGVPRQVLTRRDGLISEHVTDVAFTQTGMTVATPSGLSFVTAAGTESLYAFQGLVNNHVYALASRQGELLAGTLGGLSMLEGEAVRRNLTVTNSGLKHNWITALAAAPDGGWLVGTYGAGVMTLSPDGERFATIDLPAGTAKDLVINPNAILVTPGHVYAGTLGHGMLVYTAVTGRWSVVTRGLPSLNVTAFAEREGELYVGTENGLVRIAESSLGGAL